MVNLSLELENLWKGIATWAEREEARIRIANNGKPEQIKRKIDAFYRSNLQVSGIWWRGMSKPGKCQQLPPLIQCEIVSFMQKEYFVGKPWRQHCVELNPMFEQLGIGFSNNSTINSGFLYLCQVQVASFICAKAQGVQAQRNPKGESQRIERDPVTAAWLAPDWNGEVSIEIRDSSTLPFPKISLLLTPPEIQRFTPPTVARATQSASKKAEVLITSSPSSSTSYRFAAQCPIADHPSPSIRGSQSPQPTGDRFSRAAKRRYTFYGEDDSDLDHILDEHEKTPFSRKRRRLDLLATKGSSQPKTREMALAESSSTSVPTSPSQMIYDGHLSPRQRWRRELVVGDSDFSDGDNEGSSDEGHFNTSPASALCWGKVDKPKVSPKEFHSMIGLPSPERSQPRTPLVRGNGVSCVAGRNNEASKVHLLQNIVQRIVSSRFDDARANLPASGRSQSRSPSLGLNFKIRQDKENAEHSLSEPLPMRGSSGDNEDEDLVEDYLHNLDREELGGRHETEQMDRDLENIDSVGGHGEKIRARPTNEQLIPNREKSRTADELWEEIFSLKMKILDATRYMVHAVNEQVLKQFRARILEYEKQLVSLEKELKMEMT